MTRTRLVTLAGVTLTLTLGATLWAVPGAAADPATRTTPAQTAPAQTGTAPATTDPAAALDEPPVTQAEAEAALAEAQQLLGQTDEPVARGEDPGDEGTREAGEPAAGPSYLDGHDHGAESSDEGPDDGTGRELTLLLRDVAIGLGTLDPADRRTARGLLARPTKPFRNEPAVYQKPDNALHTCSEHACVHWVPNKADPDAPDLTDADENGTPDWVETNLEVLEEVWGHIVTDGGYRAPLPDQGSPTKPSQGPNPLLDVYLADLGEKNLYGYCASDKPRQRVSHGYCVFDEDFSTKQFRGDPLANLKATAAHEFFHAVQFAYDSWEDWWLMEGTAAWIEDEVYDDVNDNLQFLVTSPLRWPDAPLDYGDQGFQYGAWIFWRYLSESFGGHAQDDPTIIRQVWERVDAAEGGRDDYSLQAVKAVIRKRGGDFRDVFVDFVTTSHRAKRWYAEGRSYIQARMQRKHTVHRRSEIRPRDPVYLYHLSAGNIAFKPGNSLKGGWRLALKLNLPVKARGSAAVVSVHRRNGAVQRIEVRLDRKGDAAFRVPFRRASVRRVVLTLANTSTRTRCWYTKRTPYSCNGVPRDDNLPFRYEARPVR